MMTTPNVEKERLEYEISRLNDELLNVYQQLKTQRRDERIRTEMLINALGWEKYKHIVNPEGV